MQRAVTITVLAAAILLVAAFVMMPHLRSTNPDEPMSYLGEQ